MSIFDRLKRTTTDDATTAKSSDAKPAKAAAKKAAPAKAAKQATTATAPMTQAVSVLIRPLVTEKAALTGTYVFAVQRTANKTEIAKAVEAQYGVKPLHVRTMNFFGKTIRWNNQEGRRQDWKKAVVRLPKGQTINVYETE